MSSPSPPPPPVPFIDAAGAAGPRDRHHHAAPQEGGRGKDAASGATRGSFGGPGGFVAGGFAAPGGDRGERGAPRLRGAGEAHRGPESRSNALTQVRAERAGHGATGGDTVLVSPCLCSVRPQPSSTRRW